MEALDEAETELPSSGAEPGTAERAERLRSAVRAAGGNKTVARRADMPLSTVSNYMRGREMKAGALIQLARATGVRLEWLATGDGPMKPGEPLAAPPPAAEAPALRAQDVISLDDLVIAYKAARGAFAARGVTEPDARKFLAFMLAIYDGARALSQEQAADAAPEQSP